MLSLHVPQNRILSIVVQVALHSAEEAAVRAYRAPSEHIDAVPDAQMPETCQSTYVPGRRSHGTTHIGVLCAQRTRASFTGPQGWVIGSLRSHCTVRAECIADTFMSTGFITLCASCMPLVPVNAKQSIDHATCRVWQLLFGISSRL